MKEGRCVCVCVFLFHIHQPGIPPFVLYAAHPPPVTPDSELTAAADYFLRLLGVMTNPPPHTATGGWLLKVSALPWLLSYHGRSVHCSVPGILLLLFRGPPAPPTSIQPVNLLLSPPFHCKESHPHPYHTTFIMLGTATLFFFFFFHYISLITFITPAFILPSHSFILLSASAANSSLFYLVYNDQCLFVLDLCESVCCQELVGRWKELTSTFEAYSGQYAH